METYKENWDIFPMNILPWRRNHEQIVRFMVRCMKSGVKNGEGLGACRPKTSPFSIFKIASSPPSGSYNGG
jgi:hypothetical protein